MRTSFLEITPSARTRSNGRGEEAITRTLRAERNRKYQHAEYAGPPINQMHRSSRNSGRRPSGRAIIAITSTVASIRASRAEAASCARRAMRSRSCSARCAGGRVCHHEVTAPALTQEFGKSVRRCSRWRKRGLLQHFSLRKSPRFTPASPHHLCLVAAYPRCAFARSGVQHGT